MTLPTIFLSHGAPTLAVNKTAAHAFLKSLATKLPKPKAILVVSAHWEERRPTLGLGGDTIHDFYGFPQPLYRLQYPAAVARDVAERAVQLLSAAQIDAGTDATRGRDHGTWVPLLLAWPRANVPVVQMSLMTRMNSAEHFSIGQALAPLRDEGVLIVGSGSATHNLRAKPTPEPAAWATGFVSWLDGVLESGDDQALQTWQELAPEAQTNHPTAEHFEPMLVARGAAAGAKMYKMHASWEFGSLSMNAYGFGDVPEVVASPYG